MARPAGRVRRATRRQGWPPSPPSQPGGMQVLCTDGLLSILLCSLLRRKGMGDIHGMTDPQSMSIRYVCLPSFHRLTVSPSRRTRPSPSVSEPSPFSSWGPRPPDAGARIPFPSGATAGRTRGRRRQAPNRCHPNVRGRNVAPPFPSSSPPDVDCHGSRLPTGGPHGYDGAALPLVRHAIHTGPRPQ